ncbi:MAG: hypothetical protein VYA53_05290 [Acidobacteriota bacterium]|nr:hypothetical protein [Acidobacteriota bacterium]
MKKYSGIIVLAILALASSVWAQSDPLVGTWKLNLSKSVYTPGPPPQSLVHQYESVGKDTYKNSRDLVDSNGKSSHRELTLVFDGKEHPTANPSSRMDATMDRRIDAYNLEGMSIKDGKLIVVFMRFVSRDGKTLTFKTMGTNAEGQPFSNVEVFDKQ